MSNQRKSENPTGAGKKPALQVTFDPRLRLEFHGSMVTSDAGLLAYRELDAALSLKDLGENLLSDWRTARGYQKGDSVGNLIGQSLNRHAVALRSGDQLDDAHTPPTRSLNK